MKEQRLVFWANRSNTNSRVFPVLWAWPSIKHLLPLCIFTLFTAHMSDISNRCFINKQREWKIINAMYLYAWKLWKEITMLMTWILPEGSLSSEWLCMCTSYYFVYLQKNLRSVAGCDYLWKADTRRRDMKPCWLNNSVWRMDRILIYFAQKWVGPVELRYKTSLMLIFSEKSWIGANKSWEKEVVLYRFFLRALCCPQRNPSWKDNYFLLRLIFEGCSS